jgi:hypothetical protein
MLLAVSQQSESRTRPAHLILARLGLLGRGIGSLESLAAGVHLADDGSLEQELCRHPCQRTAMPRSELRLPCDGRAR